jgi:hypothetical protein
MPNFYPYIIASLPLLNFRQKPAINSRGFLDSCAGLVTDRELAFLKNILEGKEILPSEYMTLKRWVDFETSLGNELVKLRADRKRKDPHRYIRKNTYWDADIDYVEMAAYKNPSIYEAEKLLDLERWRFLEELSFGHHFDFELLLLYALKLKILERWKRIDTAERERLLEEALN